MNTLLRNAVLAGTVVSLSAFTPITTADQPAKQETSSPETDPAKAKVLKWLDAYREVQVLFHDEDIARLRKELTEGTRDEALKWWSETEENRAALNSPEWKVTRDWLREFLKVQAIYSDEQIDEFRKETKQVASEGSPRKFNDILADIERKRASLVQGAANSQALRKQQLAVTEAFRKEQAAQRSAADKATAGKFTTNAKQQPVRRPLPRSAPEPLIDSLDVARWRVMRNFWR